MNFILFILIIFFLIYFILLIHHLLKSNFAIYKIKNYKKLNDNYFQCINKALSNCQIDTLNNKNCFFSHYHKCPRINGSYKQCTDNYWSYDGICKCQNRTFDMCPYPYKISSKCYQNKIRNCPLLTNKKYESCRNPRVGIFYSDTYKTSIDNKLVLY
jgi:hypothetical protein